MRSTTNLAWPTEPFGTGQRPFGKDQPMLAALAIEWQGYVLRPVWGCAVYLTVRSTRTLTLDGFSPSFGYEVLTLEPGDEPAMLVERMDELLVASRRQAKFLAGHHLAPDLDRLAGFATTRRFPGVDGVRQLWSNRAEKGRGMAKMVDTAHDFDPPGPVALTAACGRANLTATVLADPDSAPGRSDPAVLVRQALTRTLAVGLIAARSTGRYDWSSPVDVDELVTAAAWDQLDALGKNPPSDAGCITDAVS